MTFTLRQSWKESELRCLWPLKHPCLVPKCFGPMTFGSCMGFPTRRQPPKLSLKDRNGPRSRTWTRRKRLRYRMLLFNRGCFIRKNSLPRSKWRTPVPFCRTLFLQRRGVFTMRLWRPPRTNGWGSVTSSGSDAAWPQYQPLKRYGRSFHSPQMLHKITRPTEYDNRYLAYGHVPRSFDRGFTLLSTKDGEHHRPRHPGRHP